MKISKKKLKEIIKEELFKESTMDRPQPYSSKEAKSVIDGALKVCNKTSLHRTLQDIVGLPKKEADAPKATNTANNSKKKNEDLAIKKKNNPFADIGFE